MAEEWRSNSMSAAGGCRRKNDIDLEADKLSRDLDVALAAPLSPAILNRDIATLDPAEFVESLYKRGDPLAPGRRRGSAQESDSRQLARLLRVRGERPCGRASEKRDELSSLQMIESHMPPTASHPTRMA